MAPQLGREVTVNLRPGKPLETCAADDESVLASPPEESPAAVAVGRPTPAAVLALTDDPELRDLLFDTAIDEGWGVRCVASEAEAAAVLLAERPGLVVADLDMQSRAGAKFLRDLRRSPHRDIPCVAVTASNDTMLTVSIDAPVFFKPELEGLTDVLQRIFAVVPSL
jgi:CheY-like chemotaxis protein